MHNVVIEKPYQFVPPHRGRFWPRLLQRTGLVNWYLRKKHKLVEWEVRNAPLLRESIDAGHGVLLTPNHCRTSDPVSMAYLAAETGCLFYAMASWHLFNQDAFTAWAIRRCGGFSVYREGIDRQAISTAVEIVELAERPLILFPEGAVSRTNDRLHALLDGVSFMARTAAKRRKRRDGGKVVIHPVGMKYLLLDDLETTYDPVLTEIEQRLSWRPQTQLSLLDRITKVGLALLGLKEIEHIGRPRIDKVEHRLAGLIDHLLSPLETEWLGEPQSDDVIPRVKALRMKIMPEMVRGELPQEERDRRWLQLADMYLAQQLGSYPADYLDNEPTVDRLRETVERFDEDLTDRIRAYGRMKLIIEVGPAIEVSPARDRSAKSDPLMAKLESELTTMLDRLACESPVYRANVDEPELVTNS